MNGNGNKLYICGTNAYNPRDYLYYANNMTISTDSLHGVGSVAQAECPFDPEDNSTAVWVEHGNPNEAPALYTGTVTDFNKADPLIFRTELYNQTGQKIQDAKRTSRFDSKALDSKYIVLFSTALINSKAFSSALECLFFHLKLREDFNLRIIAKRRNKH